MPLQNYERFINCISANRYKSLLRQIPAIYARAPPNIIFMAGGMPNIDTFPFTRVSVDLRDDSEPLVIEGTELDKALQYMASVGHLPLVDTLKQLQTRVHNLSPDFWDSRDLLVTTGSLDGLSKAMEMCMQEGQPIIFHEPSYSGAKEVLRPYKPRFIAAPEDDEGLCPRQLRAALEAEGSPEEVRSKSRDVPKMLYVCPTGANPSGKNISTERKREIYKIACEYDLIILDDDPYYFLHFEEADPVSFLSLDTECRVLRFDSFSKILSAGLRVGFVTGPKPLLERIQLHIQVSTMHTSGLSQVLVNSLLNKWGPEHLNQHFRDLRSFYKGRRDIALAAAEKHLKGVAEWTVPGGGLFMWLRLIGDGKDAREMVSSERGLTHGVLVIPGNAFMLNEDAPSPFVRISYSLASPQELDEGFARLARMLREA